MRRLSSATQSAVTLLGSTLVAAGSLLPWLRIDPGHDGPIVLVPAVLVLGVLHGLSSRPAADLATLAVGGLSLAALATYWQTHVSGYYVPATGWYLALLGGLLLSTVGVERLWSRFGHVVVDSDEPRSV